MNKKFIVFILILSLLFPLLPAFHFTVFADTPSISENIDDIANKIIDDVKDDLSDVLGTAGVLGDPEFYRYTIWPIIAQFYDLPFESTEQVAKELAYRGKSAEEILADCYDLILAYVNDHLPYYVYHTLPINLFFSFYDWSNYQGVNLGSYKTNLDSIVSDSDCIYMLSQVGCDMNALFESELSSVSVNFLIENAFVLYDGSFSVFPDLPYQSIVLRQNDIAPSYTLNGILRFFNGVGFVDTSSIDQWRSTTTSGGTNFSGYVKRSVVSSVGPAASDLSFKCGCVNDSVGFWANDSFRGTVFLSVGATRDLLVFKSGADYNAFYSGNSEFIVFSPDYDLSGLDIDYDRLYDLLKENLDKFGGSFGDKLNEIANKYLAQQVQLLGDIKNALNDEEGYSWLRRIYVLLDENFHSLFERMDMSGGSVGDLSETNRILNEINERLGFLIDMPLDNATPKDFDDIKTLCANKFPFCIFSDIVAISVILNRPPVEPDIDIPIPIFGSESDNMVHIDLSPYEYVRPYVHGVIIFVFIIGLLALSVKVFDSVKS